VGTAVTLGDRERERQRQRRMEGGRREGGAAVNGSDWGGATINRTAEETTTGKCRQWTILGDPPRRERAGRARGGLGWVAIGARKQTGAR